MRLVLLVVFTAALAAPAFAGPTAVNPTPHDSVFQQSENAGDRAITDEVRRRIAGDQSLSRDGRNVEVMTDGGVVFLRGPVDSATEKAAIEATAQSVTGVKQVTSLLAVTAK
jgi:osmotically-inducible protein OsmY